MTTTRITGRHVLIALLVFFAIIVGVNATFIYVSLTTWTGLDTENAYVKGLNYNRQLEEAAGQRALGWSATMSVVQEDGRTPALALTYTNSAGEPLDGLAVEAVFRRPTHEGDDRTLVLSAEGRGTYRALLDASFAGYWNVRATALSSDGRSHIVEKSLWLK